jgi:pimeloyl-ACP methyl ester carboxylesterase
MTTPTIPEYLKYANLQLATEAFIRNPQTEELSGTGIGLQRALELGNEHASRFTPTAALDFANHWQALDQSINSNTGFSGTLFQCILDDPKTGAKAGELVISFRSTEFIDDAIRDNLTTNQFEIKNTGFAWGQIADMEAWFAKLKTDGLLSGPYTVTGYSLGGHLATVFNLLHPVGQTPPERVITFNGAGIGTITQGTLQDAIASFSSLRNDTDAVAAWFQDPGLRGIYRTIQAGLQSGSMTLQQADDLQVPASTSKEECRVVNRRWMRPRRVRNRRCGIRRGTTGAWNDTSPIFLDEQT